MDAPNENVFLTILRSLTGTWNYAHSPREPLNKSHLSQKVRELDGSSGIVRG